MVCALQWTIIRIPRAEARPSVGPKRRLLLDQFLWYVNRMAKSHGVQFRGNGTLFQECLKGSTLTDKDRDLALWWKRCKCPTAMVFSVHNWQRPFSIFLSLLHCKKWWKLVYTARISKFIPNKSALMQVLYLLLRNEVQAPCFLHCNASCISFSFFFRQ